MANKIKYDFIRVPGELDPVAVLMLLVDLNGDESEYALATSGASGGGGVTTGALGTTHTDGYDVTDEFQTIVAENANRISLLIINNSDDETVYIKAGGGVSVDHNSIAILPRKSYATDSTSDSYDAICETGVTVSVTVEEVASEWSGGGGS